MVGASPSFDKKQDSKHNWGRSKRHKQDVALLALKRRRALMYRPGNGGLAFESLEDRMLLSASNDLTQEIETLLSSGMTTGSVNLSSVTLGSFLSASDVTVSFQGISHQGTDWSGSVSVTADSATLELGQVFTGQIQGDAQNSVGLSGTYTLSNQPLGQGAFDFDLTELDVTASNLLSAKATDVSITYDPSAAPGQRLVQIPSLTATIIPFDNATATLNDFDIFDNGFQLADGSVSLDSLSLGSILSVSNPAITFQNVGYTVGSSPTGTIGLSVDSAELFPGGDKPFSASVTALGGQYDIASQSFSLSASDADIKVGSVLEITAKDLGIDLSPGQSSENVSIHVGSAAASLPQYGVTGNIDDLAITQAGFSIASATLSKTGTITFSSLLSIKDPSVTFTNFGYTEGQGASFNSNLTVNANEIDLNQGGSASVKATGVSGSISFQPDDLGHFTFSASQVTADVGSRLELDADDVNFDSSPAPGGNFVQFGTVTALLTLANGVKFNGTGQDFAIAGNGSFVAGPTFGVTLDVSDEGSLDWPTWLPIQITHLGVSWPNFNTDPSDFTLDLSATVNDSNLAGTSLNLSGSVQDAIIDVGLLEQGKFPITGLGGFGIAVSGNMFGDEVKGELFLAVLNTDSHGNPIPDGQSTPADGHHYLYGGIDGGIKIAGLAGFEIRVGISEFGLLDAYVDVSAPILLDPDTGLTVTNLHAGIDFGKTLPSIDDAKELKTNPAFVPPGKQTLAQWESQMAMQVANVAQGVDEGASPISALTSAITINGGATLYSAYATTYAFTLDGDLLFDTTGKVEAVGTLTLGDEVSLTGAVYIDLSQVASGKAQLLMYADAPAQAPIATIYGSVAFEFAGQTPTGQQGATTPDLGTGLTLNGSTDSGAAQGIDLNNTSFTIEFWAQRADSGRAESIISQAVDGLQIGFNTSNAFVVTFGGTTLSYATTDNAWHHWAVTFDQTTGTRTIYLDGQAVANDTAEPLQGTSTALLVGQSGSTYFNGSVDEVRVWSVARTSAEIQDNDTQSYLTSSAGLIADWRFNEGEGTSASDSSGNSHVLTLSGNPTWTTTVVVPPTPPAFSSFTITVKGELDLTLPDLPGALVIAGTATFVVSANNSSLDLSVTGTASLDPLGNLIGLSGEVHFDESKTGDLSTDPGNLYGVFVLKTGQLSQLQQLGIDVSGTAILRFNTTQSSISGVLSLPDAGDGSPTSYAYTLPKDSVSLDIVGAADFQRSGQDWFSINGELDAYFTLSTDEHGNLHPLLQVYVAGNLLIGPATASLAEFNANGFLQISDAGVAAEMTITLASSQGLADKGIALKNVQFSLLLNTTDQEVTYTTPTPDDLGLPGPLPGAGTSVDIPAAPTGTSTPAPYLQINGQGELDLKDAFDLHGSFTLLIAPHLLTFGLDMDFGLEVNGTLLNEFHVQGGLSLNDQGLVAAINLNQTTTLPSSNDFNLSASFTLEINTTNQLQLVGGITLAAGNYVEVAAQGDLRVKSFDLHGSFDFFEDSTSVTIVPTASIALGALGSANVDGTLVLLSGSAGAAPGLYGMLHVTGLSTSSLPGVNLNGSLQLEINTTATERTVTGFTVNPNNGEITSGQQIKIEPDHVEVIAGGEISVVDTIKIKGEFDITINSLGLSLDANATLTDFMGLNLGVKANIGILSADTRGSGGLVVSAALSLGDNKLGVGLFSITATPILEINTSDAPRNGIDKQTYEVALQDASLNLLGFTASATVIAKASNGVFEIDIPADDPLSVSFFGLGKMNVSGYIESNGHFSITGSIGFDEADQIGDHLYGSISATISNTGFSGSFSGGASALGIDLVHASGTLTISNNYVDVQASLSVLGITRSFDYQLGHLDVPPATSAIYWYSVPSSANEGDVIRLDAGALDSSGNAPADSSYQWTVSRNGQPFANGVGADYGLQLGDPGTYTVTVNVAGLSQSSTIQVGDVAPIIQSVGTLQAYAAGTSLTINPTIVDAVPSQVPDGLSYNWVVTKNGQPFLTSTQPTLKFTPNALMSPAAPDTYVVSLTVADHFGGSATSSSTFEVFDPNDITVNTTQDYGIGDPSNTRGLVSLRIAIAAAENINGVGYIRFDPSLAGQTILLTQIGDYNDNGWSALSVPRGDIFLDGSSAPGLTISASQFINMRLFYVAAGATLAINDLNLTGGVATAAYGKAAGGAIYNDGSLYIYNSALYGNEANGGSQQNTLQQANAYGGAIYNSLTGTLNATNTTFAANTAKGGDGFYLSYYGSMPFPSFGGAGYGGAIYNAHLMYLSADTIADNSVLVGNMADAAPQGSGIYDAGNGDPILGYTTATVYTSIIANNFGGADAYFTYSQRVNGDHNLIGNAINPPTAGTSPFTVGSPNPMLGPFADHGNGVLTFSLLPNSPAIAAGSKGGVNVFGATDGRGYARTYNGRYDIGAFQTQPYVVSNTNDEGAGSLRAVVAEDDNGAPIIFSPGLSGQTIKVTNGPIQINRDLTITGLGANQLSITTGANAVDVWKGDSNTKDSAGIAPGIVQGNVTYTAGVVDNAFQFNGTNSSVVVPDNGRFDTPKFTIGGWFELTNVPGMGSDYILASKTNGYSTGWKLLVNSQLIPEFVVYQQQSGGASTAMAFSPTPIALNTWYYLTASFDGDTSKLYVNGVQAGSGSLPYAAGYSPSTSPVVLGAASWYNGEYASANIDEFSYYNTSLDPSVVLSLSQQRNGNRIFTVASGVTATISGLTIAGGRAQQGAGIYNAGNLTVVNSIFNNNVAQGDGSSLLPVQGGAIDNAPGASLTVNGSTFDANIATDINGRGGAIVNEAGAVLHASNDTFVDNLAQVGQGQSGVSSLKGGAIDNEGVAYLYGLTIGNNELGFGSGTSTSASDGAGLYNGASASLTLINSIVADNTGGHDIANFGTVNGDHNLITSSAGLSTLTGTVSADPGFGPLSFSGGTTPTLSLPANSPAVDAGDNFAAAITALDGLIGWWRGNDNALDSAAGHNGTLVNGAAYGPGQSGDAFVLNGQGEYVALPSSADITGTGAFTVSAWIKTGSDGVIIQQRDLNHVNGEYVLSVSGGKVLFWSYGNDQYGFNFVSNRSVNDNAWHLITAVRQPNGTGQIYIDGALDNSQAAPPRTLGSGFNIYIGGDLRDGVGYFNGSIDDVALFSRALTPTEIQSLMPLGLNLSTDQRGFSRVSNGRVDIGAVEYQPSGNSNVNDVTLASPYLFSASPNNQTLASQGAGANVLTESADDLSSEGADVIDELALALYAEDIRLVRRLSLFE